MIKNFILVGLGGSIGSMLRYAVYILLNTKHIFGATLLINIIGSLLIGIITGLSMRNELFDANYKLFLAVGICGGFTTFSAFSVENLQLLQHGKYLTMLLYSTSSIILGIFATWLGYKMGGRI